MSNALNINAVLIVGLGQSSLACAQFLQRRGCSVFVFADTRSEPPMLPQFTAAFKGARFALGEFSTDLLNGVDAVVLSPGFDPRHPIVTTAKMQGLDVVGEVELFARVVDKPVIGITGTNGKSTVTVLTGELLKAAGLNVAVGGNLGVPAVELLNDDVDVYVLELSSFQLETTQSLQLVSATVLNVSDDHADRYDTYDDYVAAKLRIYQHAGCAVINQDDLYLRQHLPPCPYVTFSVKTCADYRYEPCELKTNTLCVPCDELNMTGLHNYANALAALALIAPVCKANADVVLALQHFSGLTHRMQHVARLNGVDYFNDSKATNVGATLAALSGLQKQVILIAGGVTKEQDFAPLRESVTRYVAELVLIGTDTSTLARELNGCAPHYVAGDMDTAVRYAQQRTAELDDCDTVLLSPACASFDQYKSFEARGDAFMQCVQSLSSMEVCA